MCFLIGMKVRLLCWLIALTGALAFNISEVYIITLNAAHTVTLQEQVTRYLRTPRLLDAINGTRALEHLSSLPLYTRYLFVLQGRHDHMQLSTPSMLGCLLSHMAVWRRVPRDGIVAVLEEVRTVHLNATEHNHIYFFQ